MDWTVRFLCLSFRFELLHVLNFDSVRRRMSVIVRSSAGKKHTCETDPAHPQPDTGLFLQDYFFFFFFFFFPQESTCCSVRGRTHPFFPGWCLGRWSRSKPGWSRTLL